MSMVVKNNIPAVYGLGTLNRNSTAVSKSLQKVSTGVKINSAADDNSAWAISERMRVRVRGLDQADQNTQNGRSMLKVAEGAVQSTVDILKTLKEKAVNAANDSNTDADRQTIQKELNQSIDQIDDNANVTFNGKYLVDGTKNTIGNATYTALTNQSLSTDTSAATLLTSLKSRTGSDLGILTTDKVTVSYVQGGKTYATTFDVTGSSSLATILQKAEDIDGDSYVFADRYNESVAKANGETNIATLQAKVAAARSYLEDTRTAKETAATWLTGYNSVTSAANAALDGLIGAMSTLVSNYSGGAISYLYSDANTEFQAWLTGDLNPSGLPTTGSGDFATVFSYATRAANGQSLPPSVSDGEKAGLAQLYTTYNSYVAAYNNSVTWQNNHDLSAMDTTQPPNGSSVPTEVSSEYTAPTYNTGSYADYASSATSVYNSAKAYVDSLAGPAIVSSSNIGLEKSGFLLTTVDGQKALTITAMKSGVTNQISGFSISVSDKDGNVKKSVNAYLDAFSESIRAEDESEDNALVLHVGADPGVAIKIGLSDMRAEALGLKGSDGTKLDISTQSKANAAINVLDNAIQKALNQQVTIGNISNRLEYTAANLRVASDNVQASESTIRDADMAKEMTEYTKNNVLLSASQSMLSQANQNSMDVMTLLQ